MMTSLFKHLIAVISRRRLLALMPAAGLILATRPAYAAVPVGSAIDVQGIVKAQRGTDLQDLAPDSDILLDDLVLTAEDSFAELLLKTDTTINLGGGAQLLIDQFVIDQGGVLVLGSGAMVFDRPEGAPAADVTIKTTFAMIGVRGTKFFAGPSNGVFGVFCEHGEVRVLAFGVKRILNAGDGCDFAALGEPPSEIKQWGAPRIAAAYASVGL